MTATFVDIARYLPGVLVDARYAGSNNFIGRPVAGYTAPLCLLTREAAKGLRQVRDRALGCAMDLLIYDGYRPQRAVDDFLCWVDGPTDPARRAAYHPRVRKSDLIRKGYLAPISSHSRGSAVDLTLVRRQRDASAFDALDMGTPFDFFDTASHTFSREVSGQARANRLLLRQLMTDCGFVGIDEEWWHFSLSGEPFPLTHFDFPVAHVTG